MTKNRNGMLSPQDFKILIVDDVPKNIQVLASILSDEEYQVEYATSGSDAIDWVKNDSFDLVLLDVMMPEMDGFQTCEQIKLIPEYKDVPIIFLTAKNDGESIVQGFKSGGLDYITKPFNNDELLVRVATHLELKHSKDRLREVNVWLEKKVAERTKALELANKELIRLDTAKSDFLNIISHEIRTPLNGIIGIVDIINTYNLPDTLTELLGVLESSSNRLQEFSYKALDISHFNTKGNRALSLFPGSLIDIIKQAVHRANARAKAKHMPLEPTLQATNDLYLLDAAFLGKCFNMILDNAIKFGNQGSEVKISVTETTDKQVVSVTNEGKHFPDNYDISKIRPFDTKQHYDQNPALSLFLCKQIVEAHNGEIKASNTPNGVTVEVAIPKVGVGELMDL